MSEDETIPLYCQECGQRYCAGSVEALLYRRCLCGGTLLAFISTDAKYVPTIDEQLKS